MGDLYEKYKKNHAAMMDIRSGMAARTDAALDQKALLKVVRCRVQGFLEGMDAKRTTIEILLLDDVRILLDEFPE